MVEVAIGGGAQLECSEADLVERLVVNAERLVRVLDQLVDGERRVVGLFGGEVSGPAVSNTGGKTNLNDGVRHLGTGHDGVRRHHTVGVFFPDLRDEEGTHACTGTTAQRVGDLEAYIVDQLGHVVTRRDRHAKHAPCRQSVPSASLRTTSKTASTNSAPSV